MALQGNLRDFSVTEILQLLGTQKKTGCLLLEWNTEKVRVYVTDGRIVGTREPGMRADDPLLKFLIKVHRLSDEQRRGLTSIHRESGRDLEDLLVNGRYVEADELQGFLERQILDDLMRLVRWENGSYRFDPNLRWASPPRVRLSMEGAMIEAARRVDEQKRFVGRFRDPYELLGVRDLPDPDEPLSEEEKEIFGIIDGNHTVVEIAELAPLSEYEAYESLHRMLDAQWLEAVGRRDPGSAGAPASPVPAVLRVPRLSPAREVLLAVVLVGSVLGLQFLSRVIPVAPAPPPASDVFVQQRVSHVRTMLELYRREHSRYPDRLEALVEDRWIEAATVADVSRPFRYQVLPGGESYALELQGTR